MKARITEFKLCFVDPTQPTRSPGWLVSLALLAILSFTSCNKEQGVSILPTTESPFGGQGYGGGGPAETLMEQAISAVDKRFDRFYTGEVGLNALCKPCHTDDGSAACERLRNPDPELVAAARRHITQVRDRAHRDLKLKPNWEDPDYPFETTDRTLMSHGKQVMGLTSIPDLDDLETARFAFNRADILSATADKLRSVILHELGHAVNHWLPLQGEVRPLRDNDIFVGANGLPFTGEQILETSSACIERISPHSIAVSADNANVDQNIGCNAFTKINFSRKGGDAGERYDASNGRFKPGGGRWMLNASVNDTGTSLAGRMLQLVIYRNGSAYKAGAQSVAHGPSFGATISHAIESGPNEFFELYARTTNCGAPLVISGDPTKTWLQAFPLASADPIVSAEGGIPAAGVSTPNYGQVLTCGQETTLAYASINDPRGTLNASGSQFSPGTGRWLVNVAANILSFDASTNLQLTLYKNGNALLRGANARNSSSIQGASLTATVDSIPGDTFEVRARLTDCSTNVALWSHPAYTWFQAVPAPATAPMTTLVAADTAGQTLACHSTRKLNFVKPSGATFPLFEDQSHRFIPGAGRWWLSATVSYTQSAPAFAALTVTLLKNGAPYRSAPIDFNTTAGQGTTLSYFIEAQEGDTFELSAFQSGCTTPGTLSGSPLSTWWQVVGW